MDRPLFFDLPNEVIEKILSYLSYDEIANLRSVSKDLNQICCQLLNQGFGRVDKYHAQIQREVKSQLPRRESERRNHHLARHVDILAAIETRLSLLSMTYMKYVSMGACCFIPGKVLDEMYKVLREVRINRSPPRSHEMLQELRDISSMAMEHFDENIVPLIKASVQLSPATLNMSFPGTSCSLPSTSTVSSPVALTPVAVPSSEDASDPDPSTDPPFHKPPMARQMSQVRQHLRSHSVSLTGLVKEVADCRSRLNVQQRKNLEQTRRLATQERKLTEQTKKIADQGRVISDLSKKIIEYDQKFDDILSEFARLRGSNTGKQSSNAAKDKNGNKQPPGTSSLYKEASSTKSDSHESSKKRKFHTEQDGPSKRPKRACRLK